MSSHDIGIVGIGITSLAALGFLLLESFGVRWSPRLQWLVGLSLVAAFLWFFSLLVDSMSV